jgi:hypothetical protein
VCQARWASTCIAIAAVLSLPPRALSADAVSFRNDVMAVLARAGCNQGACHGNLNGKGGFKLSLRGEDPDSDYAALTRDMLARRVDPQRPEDSLILRKPGGSLPHEGGVRFSSDSGEYQILSRWIAAGTPKDAPDQPTLTRLEVSPSEKILVEPADRVRLSVRGHFSDGSVRDLSRLAVYDQTAVGMVQISPDGEVSKVRDGELVVLVRYLNKQVPVRLAFIPQRADFAWRDSELANPIDRHIFPQLKALRLTSSAVAGDSMFLRRAFLDATGLLPTMEETKRFLADERADKRERVIDELLQRPEFADFWALKWADLLRNEEKSLDRKGVRVFHQWIRDSIAAGKPLNEFARDVIAARGSSYGVPESNFYRAVREPYARAEAIAQVFLGTRIGCAKCHNHPFDRWTQTEYHRFAAFFAQVDYRILENNRRDKFDKHEFDGEQVVFVNREMGLKHPRTGETLSPQFLGSSEALPDDSDRLQALADWVARKDNPFFARAQVNRVWFHLMGHGLVEPDDDLRISNPPINGPLLDELAGQFADHQFDLRWLVRTIMTSRLYQLSSDATGTNGDDDTHFSHATVQPLEAEQLLDALCQVTGTPVKFNGYPAGVRAVQLAAPQVPRRGERRSASAEKFLKVFGKPDRLMSCDCERSEDTGLLQAFQLITGELVHEMIAAPDNRLGSLLKEGKSDTQIIEEFYLSALNRYPTDAEKAKLLTFVAKRKDRREALEDVVWGLVNAKEFLLRR